MYDRAAEGINNKLRMITRRAYGFHFVKTSKLLGHLYGGRAHEQKLSDDF